ncbi:endonuclease MutS2 [Mucilaginibacter gotjawali]|uniref:Endonuclease MutS2 n=2 Tax=Mucilaginibacter gotjawali TaxID=1550579 RepID=A0A120MZ11_9SPHI|nr:Smr/MutS family protein [Mucilaginibacter gotjawali]MBB3055687.1 DNA mismatch repair protein MutS2 [Mucilaginibacter gotjawali]BAU54506.1 Endonuclease MutS2 [Mucilaginibacter gotjawali]
MPHTRNNTDKLGFAEVKELIKAHCLSEMGRQMVDKIQVMHNFDQISKFLGQANEFKNILQNDDALPIHHFFDIKTLANKTRIEGVFLSEEEFYQVHASLTTVFAVIAYFNEREGLYPNLEALFEHLPIEKAIIKKIDMVIDQKGKIRPNASRDLQEITSGIARAEQEARKKIDQVFKNAGSNGWTADGSLTIRDGRLCIPLLAENKRKLKGFIHDESASGQTVYMEPEEVFTLNNRIRDLEFDRRREIIKILTALTDELRPYVPLLLSYHSLLTKLDFVRAKALFAIDIEAEMPQLVNEASIKLTNARHPLLLLNFKKEHKTVVPLNVQIDEHTRIVVVSGPNAGGKSVCMKTVGLLQTMVQAGLLISASEASVVGVFKQLFVDIGDDQSLESDLSTYSAHLSKMKEFVEQANGRTLVLIDEFGTGTDPQFGGPIAEAVLESLNHKKVKGMVTTHYSNLKIFASHTEGIENASMLFDNKEMKPLYMLEVGKPGSSYAFEIAQKIGLPQNVLNLAKNKISAGQKKVDTLLVDLEREKKEIYDTRIALEKQQRQVNALLAENETLKSYLEENKKALIRDAKDQAKNIILNANKLVENTISEIKSSNADKEKTRVLRENLNAELQKNTIKPIVAKPLPADEEIKPGDWVKLADSETTGQVIEIIKDNVVIAIGDLRTVAKKKRIIKVAKSTVPKEIRRNYNSQTGDMASFNPEIDVRGMRTEDALSNIERLFDRALMMGFGNLKIIHGKGDGILRKMIRQYLKKYDQVDRMEDEHADRGGDGITYVYFK